jgi:hypothetical protein
VTGCGPNIGAAWGNTLIPMQINVDQIKQDQLEEFVRKVVREELEKHDQEHHQDG